MRNLSLPDLTYYLSHLTDKEIVIHSFTVKVFVESLICIGPAIDAVIQKRLINSFKDSGLVKAMVKYSIAY